LLAEVLAGHVGPPLGGKPVGYPAVDPAIEHGRVAVTHSLHGGRRELRAPSIVITQDDGGARERHGVPHQELQLPSRDRTGARNMAAVVLARFPDVDQGERRATLEETLERLRRYRARHG